MLQKEDGLILQKRKDEEREKMSRKKIVKIVLAILFSVLSFFVLAKAAASPETYKKTIQSLDEKKLTVTGLATGATAASVAVSAMPTDIATPIADKLADLSSYFLLVLSAILLEKYMITVIGFIVFKLLIPLGCILFIMKEISSEEQYHRWMTKVWMIGIVSLFVIPSSEMICDLIQNTHKESIESVLNAAKEEIVLEESVQGEEEEKKGLAQAWDKITDAVANGVDTVKEQLNKLLNGFIEGLAIMIVTSCLIPILTVLFFAWFIKFMLGINVNLPKLVNRKAISGSIRKLSVRKNNNGENEG